MVAMSTLKVMLMHKCMFRCVSMHTYMCTCVYTCVEMYVYICSHLCVAEVLTAMPIWIYGARMHANISARLHVHVF